MTSQDIANMFVFKKGLPKIDKAGSWKEGTLIEDPKKTRGGRGASAPQTSTPPPAVVVDIDDTNYETFATSRPLLDFLGLQQCKHCKKSILKPGAKAHILQCLLLKKVKAQRKKEAREARERAREQEAKKADEEGGDAKGEDDSDGEDDDKRAMDGSKAPKKATSKRVELDSDRKGKKRKADTEAEKAPKSKKKKEEVRPKTAKPKGPVDVERQCGVLLPNGQPCARSLTCKSHSMGAKRAVVGRSLPYDMLLAAYQKKNQAKQQKAALDANAPVEEEDDTNGGPVDSDEETAAVMGALAQWNPQPAVQQPVFHPIKRQYNLARIHEQLQLATNGGRTNIFKVVGYGAQKLPEGHPSLLDMEDALGEPDTAIPLTPIRRTSTFGHQGLPPRRPSITSHA